MGFQKAEFAYGQLIVQKNAWVGCSVTQIFVTRLQKTPEAVEVYYWTREEISD